jgi:hypothetical protein
LYARADWQQPGDRMRIRRARQRRFSILVALMFAFTAVASIGPMPAGAEGAHSSALGSRPAARTRRTRQAPDVVFVAHHRRRSGVGHAARPTTTTTPKSHGRRHPTHVRAKRRGTFTIVHRRRVHQPARHSAHKKHASSGTTRRVIVIAGGLGLAALALYIMGNPLRVGPRRRRRYAG